MTESTLTISVTGESEERRAPERATVHLRIAFDGPARDEVVQWTESLHRSLGEEINQLFDPESGPISWWGSDQVSAWGERPWNQQGEQLPIVHHATAGLQVRFDDFAVLGTWLTAVAQREGVTVSQVQWDLTDQTRESVTAEVQTRAIAAAVTKATRYAQALGHQQVEAVAISDPGLLGTNGPAPRAMLARAESTSGFELRPADITVRAEINAQFRVTT